MSIGRRCQETDTGAAVTTLKDLPTGGKETILLVDDEAPIRSLGIRLLGKAGYTVLTAPDGRAALETYQSGANRISLLSFSIF